MTLFVNKKKMTSTLLAVVLIASFVIMSMPTQAQTVVPSNVTPTNKQTGASIPLPAGVTPDYSVDTLARLAFQPNPVGIGQTIVVNVWTEPPVHASRYYTGLTVTITKPDGKQDIIGPISTFFADTTSWFPYTPDQLGTYQIRFDFPGAYFPPGNYTSNASFDINTVYSFTQSIYYKPASSPTLNLTVQKEQVLSWPVSPLPSDYWTRPISPENREWFIIGGSYPATGVVGQQFDPSSQIRYDTPWPADTNLYMSNYNFIPYVQAPKSAHVLWKQQGAISGIIGGKEGVYSALSGGVNPTIVFAGRAYATYSKPGVGTTTQTYWQCYDLRTGQLYWERPLAAGETAPTVVSYWYTPPVVAAGGVGVPGSQAREALQPNPSLMSIGNRLIKYDPYTGAVGVNSITGLTLNFTGMSGTFYNDPYVLSVQTLGSGANTQYQLINWTTAPVTDNFTSRIISNVTWPFSSLGTVDYETGVAVVTASITPPAAGVAYGQRIMGASIITGKLLWNVTTDLAENTHGSFSGSTAIADHGKFAMRLNDGHWHTWDLLTGQPSWVSELSSYPWGIFGIYGVESAYGLLYYPQYDGVVAYNWTTGKIAWIYTYPAQFPYETLFGSDYAFYQATVRIADGVLYAANSEHSPTEPIARGWKIHAINATTGAGIWNLTGAMTPGAVADGYMTLSNGYDGYMYVIGRGQSATTVTAPQTAQPLGTTILIQGTVTDQSLAQKGTPCVSQDSMATQMEYLHMQLPIDGVAHNISMTGVPVKLTALDPNNNIIDIGTVTTNPYYGTFSFGWKPSVEGAYTITASFAADDSYGSSSAATALLINPAPTQTASATSIPGTAATSTEVMTYVAIVGIAIIIAIAIATVLIIRKGKL